MPKNNESKIGAVVVAAGTSSRMGGIDKIFAPIMGVPLVAYSLDQLEGFSRVNQIILVLDHASLERGQELVLQRGYKKVRSVCPGGLRRQDSVLQGIQTLEPCDWVVVHDGARPCLDYAVLERGLESAVETGAAVAGVPVKDTIKAVSPQQLVVNTPDRQGLWAAQTPQIFRYDLLLDAHQRCTETVTDDAAMVESLGHKVKMFLGSYENLKVTTPEDLALAEIFLRARTKVL
ncbi:MAG: 2-C-methyl-D-erythritol 4-phosphate cytidylyltransferase [SAR202 cluster bacterium Io17-Chloro-G4]|nr:MAG: 2-C-methyl-D-erythritol 4-phosphate cytidylyltransferase [SAR202 cluster bacterium Io17-Chloro-G4]